MSKLPLEPGRTWIYSSNPSPLSQLVLQAYLGHFINLTVIRLDFFVPTFIIVEKFYCMWQKSILGGKGLIKNWGFKIIFFNGVITVTKV